MNALKHQMSDQLFPAKLMYTVYNAGQAAVVNFFTVFFQDSAKFSKWEIGVLQALPCLCAIIAPPFWGAIADRLQQQRWIHNFCLVSGAFLMFSLRYITGFYAMCFMVILANFQTSPNPSLLDQAVMNLLDKVGGEYGKQRLFGAVGYGFGACLTSFVVAAWGISWMFNIHVVFSILSLYVLSLLPAGKKVEGKLNEAVDFVQGLRLILRKNDVLVLFFVVFLMGLMFGVISSFLTLYMFNLSNHNAQIVGIAIACETTSELPAFFFANRIIKRLGIVNVLILSVLGYALRITYYSVMVNPWTAIPFEFLHGVTFGLAWAACTQYVYNAAPAGADGTIMGLLNAVQNGLGRGAGTLIGGWLYQSFGAVVMWRVTNVGVLFSLLGIWIFNLVKDKKERTFEDDEEGKALGMTVMLSPLTSQLKSPVFKKRLPEYGTIQGDTS